MKAIEKYYIHMYVYITTVQNRITQIAINNRSNFLK